MAHALLSGRDPVPQPTRFPDSAIAYLTTEPSSTTLATSINPLFAGSRALTEAEASKLEKVFGAYSRLIIHPNSFPNEAEAACSIVGFTKLVRDVQEGRARYAQMLIGRSDFKTLNEIAPLLSRSHILAAAAKQAGESPPLDAWAGRVTKRCYDLETSRQTAIDLTRGLAMALTPEAASVIADRSSIWDQFRPVVKAGLVVAAGVGLSFVPWGSAIGLCGILGYAGYWFSRKNVPTAVNMISDFIFFSNEEGSLNAAPKGSSADALTGGWTEKAFNVDYAELQIAYAAGVGSAVFLNAPRAVPLSKYIVATVVISAVVWTGERLWSRYTGAREDKSFKAMVKPRVFSLVTEIGLRLDRYREREDST